MSPVNGESIKTEESDSPVEAQNGKAVEDKSATQEVEYVVVADSEEGERIELPTNAEDNTLGLTTLTHAFPGAHGLKYKNPTTGAARALLLDPTGSKFFPPSGGWDNKVFFVIFSASTPVTGGNTADNSKSRTTSEQNPKRKKMMDDADASASDGEGGGSHYGSGQVTAKQKRMDIEDAEDEQSKCSDLIVLGLPYKLTEDEFREYFEQFGKVVFCEIKKGRNGESKGFGFVRMENDEAQVQVLGTITHSIGGRKCQVKVPLSKKGEALEMELANSKLFVGRLQEKTNAETLKNFFLQEAKKVDPKATIVDLFIPKPFRSFAFVTFSSAKAAKELIKKGDLLVDGYSVSVSSAAPKQPPAPFGGSPSLTSTSQRGRYFEQPSPRMYPDWEPPRHPQRYEPFGPDSGRFDGGYGGSKRYSPAPMMGPGGSQSLATGLETLNLNNMNPDVMNAAWKAFWSVANNGPASSTPPPPPVGVPPPPGQRFSHPRGGMPSHGPPSWR